MLLVILSLFTFLVKLGTTIQVAPTWVTSPYVQAASAKLINGVKTGNTSTPIITMTFATAFSAVPNLGYGIIRYEGNDYLGSEMFEIRRVNLTKSSFTVKIQITGYTNFWYLHVRYIVIDDAFPHHLNSFDNVPINYTRGALSNISKTHSSPAWYANKINYTKQALNQGYRYNSFAGNFSNYKIVLFMTSLFHRGDNQVQGETNRPLDLKVATKILTKQIYMLNVTYSGIGAKILRLHFSIIIFDQVQVQATKKYFLYYQKINFPTSGGFVAVPQNFVNNLMIGYAQYATKKTHSMPHFNILFQVKPRTTTYGVYMPISIPRYNQTPFIRFTFSLLYMKTWVCPTNTFFNISNDLCQSCPIDNCLTCRNINLCQTCNTGYSFNPYGDVTQQCTLCPIQNCLICKNPIQCSLCNQIANYYVNSSGLCQTCTIQNCVTCLNLLECSICNETDGYFINQNATSPANQCAICTIPNCIQCLNLTTCMTCNQTNGYLLNDTAVSEDGQCVLCTIPWCVKCLSFAQCSICQTGYMLNPTGTIDSQCLQCLVPNCVQCLTQTNCAQCDQVNLYYLSGSLNLTEQCALCSIPHCIQCLTQTDCTACDEINNYFSNPNSTNITNQCILCTVPYCLQCATPYYCLICNQSFNYFTNVNSTSVLDQCIQCNISQCILCSNLTECMICNQANNYFINVTDLQCIPCQLSNCILCDNLTACLRCDTANLYFINKQSLLCIKPPLYCGQGIFLPPEQCDDGNNINGDGCSSTCKIQDFFSCEPNPSIYQYNSLCFFTQDIIINVLYIQKLDFTNQIQILLQISPNNLSIWDTIDFTSMLTLSNMDGFDSYTITRNDDGTIKIIVNYNTDIQDMNITVSFDPSLSGQLAFSRIKPIQKDFQIIPTDNQAAVFYDQNVYNRAQLISNLSYGIAATYLLFFIIALFGRKLVGVQMMAVIQISYLSLITLTNMNPCFNALSNIWFVNGFNYFSLFKGHLKDQLSPLQFKGINLYSRFLENYNLTILLIIIPFLVGITFYILSKTVFKSKEDTSKKLYKLGKNFMFQYVFTGIMFSGYILTIAVVLELIYGLKYKMELISVLSIVQIPITLLLLVIYFVLIIVKSEYFGEYIDYFKEKPIVKDISEQTKVEQKNNQQSKHNIFDIQSQNKGKCQLNHKWYNIMMLQRFIVGSLLIVLFQIQISSIATISLFILLSIFTIIRKPYLKTIHNIRFICNMIISIGIQAIYLTYRIANFQDQKSEIWLMLPFVVCGLLILCLIFNISILVSEFVRCKKTEQVNQNAQKKQMQKTIMESSRLAVRKQARSLLATQSFRSGKSLSSQLSDIRKQIKVDFGMKKIKPIQVYQQKLKGYTQIQMI